MALSYRASHRGMHSRPWSFLAYGPYDAASLDSFEDVRSWPARFPGVLVSHLVFSRPTVRLSAGLVGIRMALARSLNGRVDCRISG